MRRVALAAIRGYQRWISPYKGFCKEQGHCDVPCDSPGCDLPDLSCHGHGRALGDCLDVADCGCDIWDCSRSNRRRAERCRYDCCGWRAQDRGTEKAAVSLAPDAEVNRLL